MLVRIVLFEPGKKCCRFGGEIDESGASDAHVKLLQQFVLQEADQFFGDCAGIQFVRLRVSENAIRLKIAVTFLGRANLRSERHVKARFGCRHTERQVEVANQVERNGHRARKRECAAGAQARSWRGGAGISAIASLTARVWHRARLTAPWTRTLSNFLACSCAGCTSSPASRGLGRRFISSGSTTRSTRRRRTPTQRKKAWRANCGPCMAAVSTTRKNTRSRRRRCRKSCIGSSGRLTRRGCRARHCSSWF